MSPRGKNRIIAGLDIGSGKVTCFIAELDEFFVPRVIGYGQYSSSGMKRGMIVDMDRTETAIREAVNQAEDMAGVEISGVLVGLGGVHLRSHMTDGLVVLNNHEITDADIHKVIDVARARQLDGDRQVIHAQPTRYLLDNQSDIRDPRGMTGARLEADVHIISAASSAIRNVVRCVERCNLEVQDIVVQPYASALSVLVPDERELGVAMVDIGAGTSDIAIYADGALVFTAVIPVGGQHITADIARGLSTPLSQAERIKTLHGCAMASAISEDEEIEITHVGEEKDGDPVHILKSALAGIIQPRCEEMLEMVRDKIEQSGFESAIGRRVVITGGTSQLSGVKQLGEAVLDKTVRLARPTGVQGLTDLSGAPQFATAVGLLIYGGKQAAQTNRVRRKDFNPMQWVSNLGRVLKFGTN
ncbi:MAG: cell division protein FtsA [Alphaproteobacteria bacterium]|nr:cell division protein FtsA [Alphaproteobacteria bacterium]MDD9919644.1 cell division protein FtsA [Alphaproteobacteria bacterium]